MKRLAFLLLTALGCLAFLPQSAAEAQVTPSCSSLDVLILLDESGSIDRNDPNDRRIEAAKQYLIDLGKHESTSISVALAGFATTFELYSGGFLPLDSNADQLHAMVEEFGARHARYQWDTDPFRWHTDYIEAFRGLLDVPWAAECRRTVWFTDGRHDLDGGAPATALQPRPYDLLERQLNNSRNRNAVEDLLAPAICGEDSLRSEIASDYFGLANRIADSQVDAFEIKLFYLTGNRPYEDTLDLFQKLSQRDCGSLQFEHRPVEDIEHLTDEWLFDASCSSLPGVPLSVGVGDELVWDGDLPSGILADTVDSVTVLAGGPGGPILESGHGAFSSESLHPTLTRLVLSFNNSDQFVSPTVTGAGVEQACGSVTFVTPELEADQVTSTVLAGRPLVFSLRVHTHQTGWRPLTPAEQGIFSAFMDTEPLEVQWGQDGNLQDPVAPTGDRAEYRFELSYPAPIGPVSATVTVRIQSLTLQAMPLTSSVVAGRSLEFSLSVASDEGLPRPLTAAEQENVVAFVDGRSLQVEWTQDGNLRDPAAPPPGDHQYRFELRHGQPDAWASGEVDVVVAAAPFSVELLTSPAFEGRPLDFSVDAEFEGAVEPEAVVVFRNGEAVDYVWVEEGTLRDPSAPFPGDHQYRFEYRQGHPNGWVSETVEVGSIPLPPGPVMDLDHSRLEALEGREFPIPVRIDRSEGCVELEPSVTVQGEDGEPIEGGVTFADGETVWCSNSGTTRPEEVTVSLESQTNTESGIAIGYTSVSPENERQQIMLFAPGPIDRQRNQSLERLIVGLFMAALLALLWGAMYGVNLFTGRLPRSAARFSAFSVTEDGSLSSEIKESHHRKVRRRSAGSIEAGQLRILRRTPFWRIWRPPYTELSLGEAPSVGLVDGQELVEAPNHRISKDQLRRPIVLLEASEGRRRGVVMAEREGSDPTGRQLTQHVEDALGRIRDQMSESRI